MANSIIVPPNTTLLRLVINNPDKFYPQDWYYDEEFANIPLVEKWTPDYDVQTFANYSAAHWAFVYLGGNFAITSLKSTYVWTSDSDSNGDRVYVGGWNLGHKKGFQIHRYLTVRPEMFVNTKP